MPAAKRVFEGLTIVTIGVILLANTSGVLPWAVWWTILNLWPLLIVSAGLDILGRATNSTVLRVLSSLVVIGGLVYGALVAPQAGGARFPPLQPATRTSGSVAMREGASEGRAQVDGGAGLIRVYGAEDPELLAQVDGDSPVGKPSFSVRRRADGSAEVQAGFPESGWRGPTANRSLVDLGLGPGVLWQDVAVNAGAAEVSVDTGGLRLRRLRLNLGMSSGTVTIHAGEPRIDAEINGGMMSVVVRVPRDLGVEVRSDSGFSSVDVAGGGWTRTSGNGIFQGTWRTDGYDTAASKLVLAVKTGFSGVRVERF